MSEYKLSIRTVSEHADDETAIWRIETLLADLEMEGHDLHSGALYRLSADGSEQKTIWSWSASKPNPPVAQGIEQGPSKSEADGSSPSRWATFIRRVFS